MAKDIDYSKYSNEQLEAARLFANPESRLTNKGVADHVGVSERTIYRWREDREFLDLINDLADKYIDAELGTIYRMLMQQVKTGSVKAIEIALKRAGKLKEIREVSQDIQLEVQAIEGKSNEQLLKEIAEMERKALGEGDAE